MGLRAERLLCDGATQSTVQDGALHKEARRLIRTCAVLHYVASCDPGIRKRAREAPLSSCTREVSVAVRVSDFGAICIANLGPSRTLRLEGCAVHPCEIAWRLRGSLQASRRVLHVSPGARTDGRAGPAIKLRSGLRCACLEVCIVSACAESAESAANPSATSVVTL